MVKHKGYLRPIFWVLWNAKKVCVYLVERKTYLSVLRTQTDKHRINEGLK